MIAARLRTHLGIAAALLAFALLFATEPAVARGALPVWRSAQSVDEVVDLAGPRGDGRFVVATNGGSGGRLHLWQPLGALSPFATGSSGYAATSGEPYIDVASGSVVRHQRCFGRNFVYAIDQSATPGVIRVNRRGVASRFLNLPQGGVPQGITFDRVGTFGRRLLVGDRIGPTTTVFAIGCRGQREKIAGDAPPIEGGIRVAPRSFGRFGGQLIMPDELTGNVYATSPTGQSHLVVNAGTPAGPDIGVESLGFVPKKFRFGPYDAFLASAHGGSDFGPGSRTILRLGSGALRRVGVKPGDLLGASELAGTTVAIRCARRCSARKVANGPAAGHIEGHIVFARRGR